MDRHGWQYRFLDWTTCAVRAALPLLAPLSRQRRNSNAVHLWRFSYSQTSWLLTRGGSESLGESRLPPASRSDGHLMGPMAGLDNAHESAAGTVDPGSAGGPRRANNLPQCRKWFLRSARQGARAS